MLFDIDAVITRPVMVEITVNNGPQKMFEREVQASHQLISESHSL